MSVVSSSLLGGTRVSLVHRVLTRYLCQSCRSVVTLGTKNGITKVHAATGASEQRSHEAARHYYISIQQSMTSTASTSSTRPTPG